MQATDATRSADTPVQGRAITRTRHSWHLAKLTETLLMYFFLYFVYDVISAYSTYEF